MQGTFQTSQLSKKASRSPDFPPAKPVLTLRFCITEQPTGSKGKDRMDDTEVLPGKIWP